MNIPTRAISYHQPWATGLAYRVDGEAWKRAEFRRWPLPKSLIGERLAIHATKAEPTTFCRELPGDLPRGAVVGIVVFGRPIAFDIYDDGIHGRDLSEEEVAWLADEPGCPGESIMQWDGPDKWWWAWPVRRAVALVPIPCVGHQGIWPLPVTVRRAIRTQQYQRSDLPRFAPLSRVDEPVLPFALNPAHQESHP